MCGALPYPTFQCDPKGGRTPLAAAATATINFAAKQCATGSAKHCAKRAVTATASHFAADQCACHAADYETGGAIIATAVIAAIIATP